jgi:ergothioneine biosynthesis protein EgtB
VRRAGSPAHPAEALALPRAPDAERAPSLLERYRAVRARTEGLCETLAVEDYVVQTMPDVSPAKWHLAHASWFFETFLLAEGLPGHRARHPQYELLFNSYYNSVGPQFERARRGLLTRPTVEEVYAWRAEVDAGVEELFRRERGALPERLAAVLELGLNHEEQHQELLLTDIKHVFSCNPLAPVFREGAGRDAGPAAPPALTWTEHERGVRAIGHAGPGFAFDNEGPRHEALVLPFRLADRPVTEGEYAEFLDDGGYARPELWLADGWSLVRAESWSAPLHWREGYGSRRVFTLGGERPLDPARPVAHLSYFEADAYARWSGARLPSEVEWEVAAVGAGPAAERGAFQEDARFDPVPLGGANGVPGPRRLLGDVWEWTASAYAPYPGYRPPAGALGEYNGKFMCNQLVLRGGSCATPREHVRATYRNFFYPHQRWQFTGLRLAQDV